MGYDIYTIQRQARLERHNGPGDEADNAAYERFQREIDALIDSDPDYRRIFSYGERLHEVRVG